MSENDIIAEYVRKRYPELLNTADFVFFKCSCAIRKIINDFKESLKNIDFSELAEQIKDGEEDGD